MDTVAELQALDKKYGDEMYKLWGPSLLGYPEDTDSSRQCMFTSNIKQILNPVNPQVARIQTRYERLFGKFSSYYKKLEGSWEVVDKIHKYNIEGKKSFVYMLVIYNKDTDTYDMIERTEAEDLVEKFGFLYNNEVMDNLEPGDVVVDDILYKSTSYDDDGNYNLGVNALAMYSTSTETIEDAVFIRRGFAESILIPEVDHIEITINDNDVLLNLHGDKDNYKTFPDIGEIVRDNVVCATRRINKEQLLYAFQTKNMSKIFSTDLTYVTTSKNAMVYDIDVYYNNDDPFPDNTFFKQLKVYYDQGCEYAEKVKEISTKIKNSGSKYTPNVTYYKSLYQKYNNQESKWKNKDRAFSNMNVKIKVRSILSLAEGYKMVGRYGDKGVISQIGNTRKDVPMFSSIDLVDDLSDILSGEITDDMIEQYSPNVVICDDADMPYLEDGRQIDLILNASGAIRRLNTGQLHEVDLNFIAEGVRRYICTLDNDEDKVKIIFKFLSYLEEDQYNLMTSYYESLTQEVDALGYKFVITDTEAKRRFVQEVEEKGFYLVKYPDSHIRYDTIKALYEEFDFIKPLPIFVDKFGIKGIQCMRNAVVGEKYMYVLKQTANKQFSARSTGRIDRKNLPQKSTDKKNNRSTYSETPIMIGEPYNLRPDISGRTLAEYSLFMRSSPLARKQLKKILSAKGNPLDLKKLKIKETFVNNNAMVFNQYAKGMGWRLHIVTDDMEDVDYRSTIVPMNVYGNIIYDVPTNKEKYMQLYEKYFEILKGIDIEEKYPGEKNSVAWYRTLETPEVRDLCLPEGLINLLGSSISKTSDIGTGVKSNIYLSDDSGNNVDNLPIEEHKPVEFKIEPEMLKRISIEKVDE